jgi:tRNA (guanine-N7-)-methyltransferase
MYTIDFCPPTDAVKLQQIVVKHVATLNRFLESKPVAQHTARAFGELQERLIGSSRSIILDSGCGTGRSSLRLGQLHPNTTVIGVDGSIARLSKNPSSASKRRLQSHYYDAKDDAIDEQGSTQVAPDDDNVLVQQVSENVWLVCADLIDFWRLLIKHKWNVEHHYLLYPNPYPKQARL